MRSRYSALILQIAVGRRQQVVEVVVERRKVDVDVPVVFVRHQRSLADGQDPLLWVEVAGLVADADAGVEEWGIVVVVVAMVLKVVVVRVDAGSMPHLAEAAWVEEEVEHFFAYCFAYTEVALVEAAVLMEGVDQLGCRMNRRMERDTAAVC